MPESDHDARRRAYEHVVECVRHQTSPKQPPGVTGGQLWTHLVDHGNLDHEEANKARQAALENDDLVQWRDTDGTTRYTCADDAEALTRARDRLTAGIDEWSERDKASLGAINTALMEVRDE